MEDYTIVVKDLTRKFDDFVAVDRINFQVKKGEVFGFLGPNGAGKTTTIRMLCAILDPTSGEGRVVGYDIKSQPEEVKKRIGYMSQKFSLYEDLTVEENLDFYAGVYQVPRKQRAERKKHMIEMADLKGREKTITANLAQGLKQRLALGCAIVHEPQVLFLDEPTTGVDPISRRHFWDLIYNLSEKGVTVLVTTHYMAEAEYCEKLVLIYDGKIIAQGSPRELKQLRREAKLEDAFMALIEEREREKQK